MKRYTENTPEMALVVPMPESLLCDLQVLALLDGREVDEYGALVLDAHVNGQRHRVDAAIQKYSEEEAV